MTVKSTVPFALALTLASSSAIPAEPGKPAEADLYMHMKDALKNPQEAPGLPRVLLIGDSISIGYTIPVRHQLAGKALVFRPPVNCQHTGYGLANLAKWLGTNTWDVIHFNWGIWDTHMIDAQGNLVRNIDENNTGGLLHIRYTPEQYRTNLTHLVETLQATGAKLIWASSTPIMSRTGARFEDIAIRNAVAAELMKARNIEIDDLYAFTLPHVKEWQNADQVHFNDLGNAKLGEQVGSCIARELDGKRRPGERP